MQIICRVFHTCAKLFSASLLFSLIHQSYSSFILFCYFYFLLHNNRTLLFANIIFLFQNILQKLILPKFPQHQKTEQISPSRFFILHQKPNIRPFHFSKPNVYLCHFRLFHKNHITHKKQLIKRNRK